MRSLYPAVALVLALAAAAAVWHLVVSQSRGAVTQSRGVTRPSTSSGPVGSVTGSPRPASPRTAAGTPSAAPTPRALPVGWRGKIVRQRVRRFPEKLLALTFDDGPSPEITPLVLKALKDYDARATFFLLGRYVKLWPELVKHEVAAGHAVGNHSYRHPSSTTPTEACSELDRTAEAIEQAAGYRPQLFRPPYGITKGNLCQRALSEDYTAIMWTISSADSNPIGPDVIARNVIHTPNPGDIVLMHDGPGHVATAKALPQILRELSAAGFRFVTVPELLQAWQQWEHAQKAEGHAQE